MISLQAFISLFYSFLSCKDELPGLVKLPIQFCSAFVCLFSKSDPVADLACTIWHTLLYLFISQFWYKKDSQFIYNNITNARITHSMTYSLWLILWLTDYNDEHSKMILYFIPFCLIIYLCNLYDMSFLLSHWLQNIII